MKTKASQLSFPLKRGHRTQQGLRRYLSNTVLFILYGFFYGFFALFIALTGTVSHAATFFVDVGDYYFAPSDISISTGDTVQWGWVGVDDHNVTTTTCQDAFGSPDQSAGSFDHTFNTAGDCSYECTIHPEMTGVVHVTGGGGPTPPNPPTNLNATVQGWTTMVDWTTINLTWVDNATDETGFRIERCSGSGCTNFAPINTVGPGVQAYSDPGLAQMTTFRYQVIAYNGAGDSSPNPIDEATTGPDSTLPTAPGTPNVNNGGDGTTLDLAWAVANDPESGIDHYIVYRDTVAVITGGCAVPSGSACTDDGLTEGTQYCYTVAAVNGSGDEGPLSGQACGTPIATISPYFTSVLTAGSSVTEVGTGNEILIGDFIIEGDQPQQILMLGRGPFLGDPPYNRSGVLANPYLRLYSGSTVIAQNDNWQTTDSLCLAPAVSCGNATDIANTGLDPCQPIPGGLGGPPTDCNLESSLLITLPPGAYTYRVTGVGGGTGVGYVGAYNMDGPNPIAKFEDLSGRGLVPSGAAMAGGFIVEGNSPLKVLVKGRGPFMAGPPYNVPGTLANPTLELFDSTSTLVAQNDDWQTTNPLCAGPAVACGDAQNILDTNSDPCQNNPGETTPPANCGLEAAILVSLPPGSYFPVLRGVGGGSGIGLVNAVDVDTPEITAISTRADVQTADKRMIAGFNVAGSVPKQVIIKARGPSLVDFGVSGTLANPTMRLFSSSGLIALNDDWQDQSDPTCSTSGYICGDDLDIQNTGLGPCENNNTGCALESAILITLPPGAYTAVVSGVGGGTGVGIAEVYEVVQGTFSEMTAISTRADVQTADKRIIAGINVKGNEPKQVIVKARGPSLVDFGVSGTLANPTMRLFSSSGLIALNDDWQDQSDPTCSTSGYICGDDLDIQNTGLGPCENNNTGCALESAILITLPPGAYTAVVSGVGGGTGVGIVEAYEVE